MITRVEVVVLWSDGRDQILELPDCRDENWIFSDRLDQILVFPDFADRGNESETGATEGNLTAKGTTKGKLTATERKSATVYKLVAAWSKI